MHSLEANASPAEAFLRRIADCRISAASQDIVGGRNYVVYPQILK